MVFLIKDYQIDHYLDDSHYPIVLAPLSDKTYDEDQDYNNVDIQLTNLKISSNFYQVDSIFVILKPIDLRLEYKFIEKVNDFVQAAKAILYGKDFSYG